MTGAITLVQNESFRYRYRNMKIENYIMSANYLILCSLE